MAAHGAVFLLANLIFSTVHLQAYGFTSIATDATVAIKNPLVTKCFAHPVKIYAFPDTDTSAGLDLTTFERYEGNLPLGYEVTDIGFQIGSKGQVLCMSSGKGCGSGQNPRTGAFVVTVEASTETQEIIAIANPDLDLKPIGQISYTISQGETADLGVQYDYPSDIVWTHNGYIRKKWRGELHITVSEAGIYQAFSKKWRHEGRVTFRVIKRACPDGAFGATCDQKCPPTCTAGRGVCDDKDGTCICAPGLTTDTEACDTVAAGFGIDGSHLCEANGLAYPGCRGILFCLRDPYGCSCFHGIGGVDCNIRCPTGMYGPNCDLS